MLWICFYFPRELASEQIYSAFKIIERDFIYNLIILKVPFTEDIMSESPILNKKGVVVGST